jgi:hypothetical protein
MLINFSNHPYSEWSDQQKEAALIYGRCIDIDFPDIDPSYDTDAIEQLSNGYLEKILNYKKDDTELVIHIMGEMTFTFCLVKKLQSYGMRCIASCAKREVTVTDDGVKHTVFNFERFRDYD